MSYIVFKYRLSDRVDSILHEISVTNRLGMQLCMLFELLLIRVCELQSFQSEYDITKSAGMSIPLNELYGYFKELDVPLQILHPLEQFRNAYVHNGALLASNKYAILVRHDKVFLLIKLAIKLGITLDFTLDL